MSWACIIPKLSSLLRSVEKLSSMKPVSGAIKVGDHWSRNHIRAWGQAAIWERDKRTWDFDLEQEEVPRASISETVTSWCVCVQGIELALAPLSSIALVCPLSAWSVKSLAWVLPFSSTDFWEESEQGISICRNLPAEESQKSDPWGTSVIACTMLMASISWSLWPTTSAFSSYSSGLYSVPCTNPYGGRKSQVSPSFLPSLLTWSGPSPETLSGLDPVAKTTHRLLCLSISGPSDSILAPNYWTTKRLVLYIQHLI